MLNGDNLIAVMQRCELKYIVTEEQKDQLLFSLSGHMEVDRFGKTTFPAATAFMERKAKLEDSQICREIKFFWDHYIDLSPSRLILYDRTAYFDLNGDIRLTIDEDPRYKLDDLDLQNKTTGAPLLPKNTSILEIKLHGAMPLWLSHLLSENQIYKNSFSKYGEAYKTTIVNNQCGKTKQSELIFP